MATYLNTETAPQPFSNYSQAVEVPPGSRVIAVSGQVGVSLDGKLADIVIKAEILDFDAF